MFFLLTEHFIWTLYSEGLSNKLKSQYELGLDLFVEIISILTKKKKFFFLSVHFTVLKWYI